MDPLTPAVIQSELAACEKDTAKFDYSTSKVVVAYAKGGPAVVTTEGCAAWGSGVQGLFAVGLDRVFRDAWKRDVILVNGGKYAEDDEAAYQDESQLLLDHFKTTFEAAPPFTVQRIAELLMRPFEGSTVGNPENRVVRAEKVQTALRRAIMVSSGASA